MTKPTKPVIHARDHEHGGADPVRITWESTGTAGTGSGIQYDINNVGDWLSVETTGETGGRGMLLEADIGKILISADAGVVEIDSGTDVTMFPGRDFVLDANRDIAMTAEREVDITADTDIFLKPANGGTGYVKIYNLPTSDPGVSGALWVSSGVLMVSP